MTAPIPFRRSTGDPKPLPSPKRLHALFAYEDGRLFWRQRPLEEFPNSRAANSWNAAHVGKRAGSQLRHGYRLIPIDGDRFLEHRVIHHMMIGPVSTSDKVDHIDHDHTNNRAENLRVCTHAQNLMNQPARAKPSGLPKHVYWNKREQKFQVYMRANGARRHVGTFATLEEAMVAAAKARAKFHGQFANDGVRP